MTGLSKTEARALQLFKDKVLATFPEQVDSVQLFGSKARGEATKWSDIDVLVILRDGQPSDRGKVSSIAARVLGETDIVFSTKTFSQAEFDEMKRLRSMFWQSIEPDLVEL